MDGWAYKIVISERFQSGVWYAIVEDDTALEQPLPMQDYLNNLGKGGWELIAVVPVGETQLMHDQTLKHILKRKKKRR
jgi:hypothetical protein